MHEEVPRSIVDNHRPDRAYRCKWCMFERHGKCMGGDCTCTCRSEFAPIIHEDA